jgi:hypothetical protein
VRNFNGGPNNRIQSGIKASKILDASLFRREVDRLNPGRVDIITRA